MIELRTTKEHRLTARRLVALFDGRARRARARNALGLCTAKGDPFALDGLERARERFAKEHDALGGRLLRSWS